jgi:hypothetical protein
MSFLAHTAAKRVWQVLFRSSHHTELDACVVVRDSLSERSKNREMNETLGYTRNYAAGKDRQTRVNNKTVEYERSWAELRPTITNVPQIGEHFPTILRSWAELRPGTNYTPPTINDE